MYLYQKIIGIDIEIGSNANPKYSIYLLNFKYKMQNYLKNLSSLDFILILETSKPNIIATDNVQELLISPEIADFLLKAKDIEIKQITALSNNKFLSVINNAKNNGYQVFQKPRSQQTSVILAQLAEKGVGSTVEISKYNSKFKTKFIQDESNRPYIHKLAQNKLDVHERNMEYTSLRSNKLLKSHNYIRQVIAEIGHGKEASVFLAKDISDKIMVVKFFRMYSSIAKKIKSNLFKVNNIDIPTIMAKDEERNLKSMYNAGIPVPKVLFRDGPLIGMEAIFNYDSHNQNLALPLSKIPSSDLPSDYEKMSTDIFDILLKLFLDCRMVHGDYSPNNILYDGEKFIIIDVSQARLINFNTFSETPLRIRMDTALNMVSRDIDSILKFMKNKFRLQMDKKIIFNEFLKIVPGYLVNKIPEYFNLDSK